MKCPGCENFVLVLAALGAKFLLLAEYVAAFTNKSEHVHQVNTPLINI